MGYVCNRISLRYILIINRVGHRLQAKGFDRKLSKITGGIFITMGDGVLLSSRT